MADHHRIYFTLLLGAALVLCASQAARAESTASMEAFVAASSGDATPAQSKALETATANADKQDSEKKSAQQGGGQGGQGGQKGGQKGYKDDDYLKYLTPDTAKQVKERNSKINAYKMGQGSKTAAPAPGAQGANEKKDEKKEGGGEKKNENKEGSGSCSGGGGSGGGEENDLTETGHDGYGGHLKPGEKAPGLNDARTGTVAAVALEGADSIAAGTMDTKSTGIATSSAFSFAYASRWQVSTQSVRVADCTDMNANSEAGGDGNGGKCEKDDCLSKLGGALAAESKGATHCKPSSAATSAYGSAKGFTGEGSHSGGGGGGSISSKVTGGGAGGGGGGCSTATSYPYGFGGGYAETSAPGFANQGTAATNAATQAGSNTKGGLTFSNFTSSTASMASGSYASLWLRNKATSSPGAAGAKVESIGGGAAGSGAPVSTTFAATVQVGSKGSSVAAGCRVTLPGASARQEDVCRLQLGPGATSRLVLSMALSSYGITTLVNATLTSGWAAAGALKTEARVVTTISLPSGTSVSKAAGNANSLPSVDLVTDFWNAGASDALVAASEGGAGGWGVRAGLVGQVGGSSSSAAELLRAAAGASDGKDVKSAKQDTQQGKAASTLDRQATIAVATAKDGAVTVTKTETISIYSK